MTKVGGRAGQAFVLRRADVVDGTTANSLVADRRGPPQDDQIVKTKPPAGSCSRFLDQSRGQREPVLRGTGRLSDPE